MDLRDEKRKKDKKLQGSFDLPSRREVGKSPKEPKNHSPHWLFKPKQSKIKS